MTGNTRKVNKLIRVRCWRIMMRSVAAFGLLAGMTGGLARAQQDVPPGANLRPWEPPGNVRLPDKNDQMQMQEQQQQQKKANFAAANLERKKQIAEDAAKLVELANALKEDVDKTDKDTLSLSVIKRAETIEKLAKGIKEKMKLTVGSS